MNNYPLIVGNGVTIVDMQNGLITASGGSTVLNVDASQMRNGDRPYHGELQYLALLDELVTKHDEDPTPREDRTGTGTFSVFGRQMRFQLSDGFPLLTTKKMFTKGIFAELVWMLRGETNIKSLVKDGVHIWDEWADKNGELGPVYGAQWRDVDGVDQIFDLIQNLRDKPNDRGHVISAWNVSQLKYMALRPCHCLMQFYVDDGHLSCQLYQRSADIFLGVPFNIASYAALTQLIAGLVGLKPGEFIHTFGDLHLYANHVEQAKEQLTRSPLPFPTLKINNWTFTSGTWRCFEVQNYQSHPAIKGDVSV